MGARIGIKGYRGQSPWGAKFTKAPPPVLSKWELLLDKLGFSGDKEVLRELREGRIRSGIVAQWVRSHYRNHFVPENVLEILSCVVE